MSNDAMYLINIFRRLVNEKYNNPDHTSSSNENEAENEPPGQEIGPGDVYLGYPFLHEGQQEHIQTDLPAIDAQYFQQEVKNNGGVLLDMFNSNTIYLCDKYEMDEKVSKHMTQTGAYSLIQELNETNPIYVQQHLNKGVEQVTSLLNDLLERQCLTNIQVQQMSVQRSIVQMDYLYFLPDAHQKNIPFQPVMICCLGPTIGIARYMNRRLQPIYDQVTHSTTFFKESNAVRALENYAKQGYLQSNTLFATLHVNDLCTILPHEQLIKALQRFLNDYVPDGQIQGVTIHTIIELIRYVLQNQYFIFKNKVYRQVKGCGSGQPLNHLLANIYMFYWQEDLVKILVNKNEIFGRCLDEMFLTWNKSKRELQSLIKRMIHKKYPKLSITSSIGKNINYLDVKISYINSHLRTTINHDQDIEPRGLPYISDHPPRMYSTLIQACLIRAALICSKESDFDNERRDIEVIFIKNGYSIEYIREHINQFFQCFHVFNWRSDFNENVYDKMRQDIIEYDQQRQEMKIQQRQKEQNELICYMITDLDGEELYDFQQDIKPIQEDYLKTERQFSNMKYEVIHRPKYPSNTK
ncbi:unnamed protein product [Rotaria sp. Silwood2]|nr:unnamed protein product [Rotaria sp. Silwood2]